MLFTVSVFVAVASTAAAQSLNTAIISGVPGVAPTTVASSRPYENPFTMYLTMTNSYGVVTGMPSVVTTQPSVITAQPTAVTIAAGLETSVGGGSDAIVPSTVLQSGATNVPSGMMTATSGTGSPGLSQTTGMAPSASSSFGRNSDTRSSSAPQSTGAAAQVKSGSALLGAAALAIIAM